MINSKPIIAYKNGVRERGDRILYIIIYVIVYSE